mmetsp:Transcript_77836/g.241198  ORF Transcript_77836/g.241198 Transcript_77836/m.241198 type:complete len:464 (+) Transcript_77836:64-1455(+)
MCRNLFFPTCAAWSLLVIACLVIRDQSSKATRAVAWEQPFLWRKVPCSVLSAGVSCTDRDTGGTCGGYRPETSSRGGKPPIVFATQDIAVCPGVYWCSKEGTPCACDGDVTYASRLFNVLADDPYGPDRVEDPSFTVPSNGVAVKCGHGEHGPFPGDPSPGWVKHCWCTPRMVKALSDGTHGLLRRAECARLAIEDFKKSPDERQGPGFARRLGLVEWATETQIGSRDAPGEGKGERQREKGKGLGIADFEGAVDKGRREQAGFGRSPHREEHVGETQLGIREASGDGKDRTSSDRRRPFQYTPWALVEVKQRDIDGDDVFAAPSPAAARRLVCAYEFGNPIASEDWKSDGAYQWGSGVWDVERVVSGWANRSQRHCWVRRAGRAAEDGRACATAMMSPGTLGQRRRATLELYWGYLWCSLVGVLICTPLLLYALCPCACVQAGIARVTGRNYESLGSDLDDE